MMKIKPCPFCGRSVKIMWQVWRTKATVIHDPRYGEPYCILDNEFSYQAPTYEDAVKIWNTRKDEESDAE